MKWVLKRNCSASPTQLAVVFGSLVAVSFAFGAAFAALGLWMVLPFAGLELAAVAVAFVWIGRHATDVERIELADDRLIVERTDGALRQRWELDAARVRVRVDEDGRGPGAAPRVQLADRGESIEIGRHLVGAGRIQLVRELRGALAGARTRCSANMASGDDGA